MFRILVIMWCVGMLSMASTWSAGSRSDLLFEINTTLKMRDRIGFAECFNFDRTDVATQKSTAAIINQIFNFRTYQVTTSERDREGKMLLTKGGKTWTFNGQWTFLVHITETGTGKREFVLPAGVVKDRYRLLLLVEEKP